MNIKSSKNLFLFTVAIILTLGLSIAFQSLLAVWTVPTANPPDNNTDAPLNVGSSGQLKQGPLWINTSGLGNPGLWVTGNVGIGLANPRAPLDVNGAVRADYFDLNHVYGTIRFLDATDTVEGAMISYDYPNDILKIINNVDAVSINNAGNVGIGTAAPSEKLTVYGDGLFVADKSHVSGDLTGTDAIFRIYNNRQEDVAEKGAVITFEDNYYGSSFRQTTRAAIKGGTATAGNTANGFLAFYTDSGGANSMQERMRINYTGNVGIGTAGPSRILHIEGLGSGRGQISLIQSGTVATDSSAGIYWHSNSDYAIYRTPGAWTASNYQQLKLDWPTGIILDPGTGDNSGYNKSYVEITGGKGLRVTQGNVGIGTANPGYKFDVVGDAKISGGGAFGGYNPSVTHRVTTPTLYAEQAQIGNPAGGLMGAGKINASGVCIEGVCQTSWSGIGGTSGWTDDGAAVRLTAISDNVGIGTTNPGAKLEVAGQVKITGGSPGAGKVLTSDAAGLASWQTPAVFTEADTLQTVTARGNSTNFGLVVNGQTFNHQANNFFYLNSYDGLQLRINADGAGSSNFQINNSANSTVLTVTNAGSVGIGVINPTARLDVQGTVRFTTNSEDDEQFVLYDPLNGRNVINYNGDQAVLLLQQSGGNIGIGISDPGSYTLNVQGTARISSDLTVEGKFNLTGADVAEEFSTLDNYEAGTVLVMGDNGYRSARISSQAYDSTVIGVVSDNPAVIMGKAKGEHKAIVAIAGVIKVKVTDSNGGIKKGDLLTTSEVIGYAMKATENKPGAIIGKALEDLVGNRGEIMTLINLQ